jgi:hypothetical protein
MARGEKEESRKRAGSHEGLGMKRETRRQAKLSWGLEGHEEHRGRETDEAARRPGMAEGNKDNTERKTA